MLLILELWTVLDVSFSSPDDAAATISLPADDCSISLSKSMIKSPMPPTSHSLSSYSKFDTRPMISEPPNGISTLLLPILLFDNAAAVAADLCGLLVFVVVLLELFPLLLLLVNRAAALLLLLLLLLLLVLSDFRLIVATCLCGIEQNIMV